MPWRRLAARPPLPGGRPPQEMNGLDQQLDRPIIPSQVFSEERCDFDSIPRTTNSRCLNTVSETYLKANVKPFLGRPRPGWARGRAGDGPQSETLCSVTHAILAAFPAALAPPGGTPTVSSTALSLPRFTTVSLTVFCSLGVFPSAFWGILKVFLHFTDSSFFGV